jgi:outer membrane protein
MRLKTGFILVAALFSQTSSAADLMDIFTMSLKSDPQLLAQAASRLATNELDAQAQARFLPEVTFGANTGRVWQDTSSQVTSNGKFDYNAHGYTLSITQPVYRKANFVLQNQADIAIETANANYIIAEQALILRVAESYFDLLARQDDLTFAKAEREAISKQLEQMNERFEVGIATITDVVESQAAYDLANAEVISAENELANSKERLREVSGAYQQDLASLKQETPLVSPVPENIEEWTTVAIKQNPSLWVANSAVQDAGQNIELQKAGHHPTLDIVGQKSYDSQRQLSLGGSVKSHQDSLTLQLNVPIYSGGSIVSQTRQATYQLDQAMQQQELQRRTVMRQSREAYNGVMSGISRVNALRQAVVSGEKALESTEAGYEVGTRTTVDVLDSRRDLFAALRDYANARYEYILSTLRLKQAAGTITVNDLLEINQWLEG